MSNTELVKLPTFEDLVLSEDKSVNDNNLMVLLNQKPHEAWLKDHPTATTKNDKGETVKAKYMPIDKVEFLLSKIFRKWWVEVLDTKVIANSVAVTVRVFVVNPITGEIEHQDGVGAKSIQTNAGAGAMDWNAAKDAGVMMALPSAKTYAVKDACEQWGRIFGRDLNRANVVSYVGLLDTPIKKEDIETLFEFKKHLLSEDEVKNFTRIISRNETDKFKYVKNILSKL